MTAVLYTGEAAGARVFRDGTGLTNVDQSVGATSDYQLDVTTWDITPAGIVGDVVFRSIDAAFTCTNGYAIGITPIVDGIALPEQTFNGAGTGEQECQAFFAARGTRIAARFRTLSRRGDVEIHDLTCAHWVLRMTP
jgi:hypothetical protein